MSEEEAVRVHGQQVATPTLQKHGGSWKGARTHARKSTATHATEGVQKRASPLWFPRPPGAAAFAPLDARLFSRPTSWGSDASDSDMSGSGGVARPSWVHGDRLGWRDGPPPRARTPSGGMGVAEQFMRALVLDGRGARAAVRTISHSSFALSAE
jgi:hypothetical protein